MKAEDFTDKCEYLQEGRCFINDMTNRIDCIGFGNVAKKCLDYKPKEKTGMMTLVETIKNANKGDNIIYLNEDDEVDFEFIAKESYQDISIPIRFVLRDKWAIIPGEPKVLSAEEYLDNIPSDVEFNDKGVLKMFNAGDKNGQLKQWLNHKELRELLKEWDHAHDPDVPGNFIPEMFSFRVREAFQNLKPL